MGIVTKAIFKSPAISSQQLLATAAAMPNFTDAIASSKNKINCLHLHNL